MIGSGIFLVTPEMSRMLGGAGWVLLAWVLSGFMTLLAALSYGELAGMMPKAGGQYVYIQKAFGKMPGFLYGWSVFTVMQTGAIAAVAVAFGKYLGVFLPGLGDDNVLFTVGAYRLTAAKLVAVAMVLFLTWLNSRGVREGKWVQRIFTWSKLVALAGLILAGLFYATQYDFFSQNMAHAWDSMQFLDGKDGGSVGWVEISGFAVATAMSLAMVGSLFSSDAWNNVTFIAGEIKDPVKNIPRSLFFGTLLVTIIYILANVAYMALLPLKGGVLPSLEGQGISHALHDRVGAAAAKMVLGQNGEYLMAALIVISTFGCNNGLLMAGSRLYRAMALDGLFFRSAATLNKNEVPGNALWIQAAWASLLCLSGSYSELLSYTIFASLIFYVITILGLFVLRKREPDTPRPYRVWGYPVLPIVYILMAVFIGGCILILQWKMALSGLFIVALGIPLYYWLESGNKKQAT